MRHVIIGTAGHVDHGKTSLIKALTGIDTDRWEEEKRRGLSIGLGFAHFDLPDGSKAGIIDVPGHERFIRNMLAGVWGMDLILLVVDAIEGVRPQTIEHLSIIDLLGISTGIVVITKIDLVPESRILEVIDQVKTFLKGKLLEGSPIVRVSSVTLQGLEELKLTILNQINSIKTPERSMSAPRLPVDRVFVISGFGVIVTGTLIGGTLKKNEVIRIMPKCIQARIRGIEVHDEQVEMAFPGQRVALNLSNITKNDIERGDCITEESLTETTFRVDTLLKITDTCERVLENWTRIRFYFGTSEVFGRAVLLSEAEGLFPGDTGYVQFKLESPVFVFRGDKFIIRDFSNQETIGGGIILNPFPPQHKRLKEETLKKLNNWALSSDVNLVRLVTENNSTTTAISEKILKYYLPYSGEKQEELLKKMEEEGIIIRYASGENVLIASVERMQLKKKSIIDELLKFHNENPLAEGQNYSKLRSIINTDEITFELLLQELIKEGKVSRTSNYIKLSNFETVFTGKFARIGEEIEKVFIEKGFSPPDENELLEKLGLYDRNDVRNVYQALIRQGRLVKVSSDIVFHSSMIEKAFEIIKSIIQEKGQMTASDFRQTANTSRKYAIPLLEYCDKTGFTFREGDIRKLKIHKLEKKHKDSEAR